jgi:hypothetical protein
VRWVFVYKFDTDGYLKKYKARLCIQGDLQEHSLQDNYAATLAAQTFRALIAITAAYDLEAYQFDAVNAYTNSKLTETIYIECPEGFRKQGKCDYIPGFNVHTCYRIFGQYYGYDIYVC